MKFNVFAFIICFAGLSLVADEFKNIPASDTLGSTKARFRKVYLTDNGAVFLGAGTNHIDPTLIAEAETNRESWPAEDFPEGNWGEVMDGGQISLRFDKQVYTNREPINAVVLVRNTTNQVIVFLLTDGVAPGFINFQAYTQSGQSLDPKPKYSSPVAPNAGVVNIIQPGLQRKFIEALNRSYDLTNGTYLIEASIKLSEKELTGAIKSGPQEVKSARVRVEIR